MVSAGGSSTVLLTSYAVLNGSVSDDGLPLGTLTSTWSQVSGPGTATFDAPAQAVTAVRFMVAGGYVLRLTAPDGALTAASDVAVTVITDPNWISGWIASPLNEMVVMQPAWL